VTLDPDSKVRTAVGDSRFDGFTTGPLAIGQSLAHARMTQTPGSAPKKESSFTVGSITIAGVQVAMTDKGFKLGDQAPPTADLSQLFGVLAQAGITVEYLPATQTDTSIDSAGLRITRAGADPNGTQHKIALILGRVGASIQGGNSPLLSGDATVVPDSPPPAPRTVAPADTDGPDASAGDRGAGAGSTLSGLTGAGSASSASDVGGAGSGGGFSPTGGPVPAVTGGAPGVTRLAAPASVRPLRGPSATGFYVALLVAGLAMTVGTRLVAAVGVHLGRSAAGAAAAPVSVLRLPKR
jgi:hypothetical protein